MSDQKSIFQFGAHPVRTAGSWDAPLFCAADVCEVLGYERHDHALRRLDADEQELVSVNGGASINKAVFVTEAGLFSLILGSRKPEAKAFKKWVTSEVLPQIRKHGFYSALSRQREMLLEELFPNAPAAAKPIFRDLIGELLRLRHEKDHPKNPPWCMMLSSNVYRWSFPTYDGQQKLRRERNSTPNGSSVDHSMFAPEALEKVIEVVRFGAKLAKSCVDWQDWHLRMELTFGTKALQLPIMVPMLRDSQNPEAAE